MKLTFSNTLSFFTSVCYLTALAPVALAETYTVSSNSEFADAWNVSQTGDTIFLVGDVDLSSVGTLPTVDRKIIIEGNSSSSLVWTAGTDHCPLPGEVVFSHLTIAGAPSAILVGSNLEVGEQNTFSNNAGGVVRASGDSSVGRGNSFLYNVNAGDGGAISVQEASQLRIAASSTFKGNHAQGEGGAVYVARGATLVLDANENITFENNHEHALIINGAVASTGDANDIYLDSDAQMLVDVASDSTVLLAGGVESRDASAHIIKNGDGVLSVADASYYSGSLLVKSGVAEVREGQVWGDGNAYVELASGATFRMRQGATLAGNIRFGGGALRINGNVAFSGAITADSPSVIVLEMTDGALQQPSLASTPVISLAPGASVRGGKSLTVLLDMNKVTSPQDAGENIFVIDASRVTDAATKEELAKISVGYADTHGEHATDLSINEEGMLNISSVLEELASNPEPEPSPEPVIVPAGTAMVNSMWNSMETLSWLCEAAFGHAPQSPAPGNSGRIWGAGFGGFGKVSSPDYRFSGGGYAVGTEMTMKNSYIGFTFAQSFSSGSAKNAASPLDEGKVDQMGIMFGLYGRGTTHTSAASRSFLDVFAGYSYVNNDGKTTGASVDWSDHAFNVTARFTWEQKLSELVYLSPFIGMEFAAVSQGKVQVEGGYLNDGDAATLTMPIGFSLSACIREGAQKAVLPYLSAAYVPYLAQAAPKATFHADNASAKVKGSAPGRNAFRVEGGVRTDWSDAWSTTINAFIQTRSGSTSFHAGAAAVYSF